MAITTYSELKTAIYGWLDAASGDFSGTMIDDLILFAHQRINREIRCREMEATISATISSGVWPLPADYIDLKYAHVIGSSDANIRHDLQKRTAYYIYENFPFRAASSLPRYCAREFGNLIFGPYPDAGQTYTLGGVYWRHATLTATLTFNDVFRVHPDLYVAAAISEAIPIIGQDTRLQVFEMKYQSIKRALLNEVNTEGFEGSEVEGDG